MKYILFYGIQAGKLLSIRNTILASSGEWHALLPTNFSEAIDWIRRSQVDAVVVEFHPLDHTSIELLSTIQKIHPDIVRIAIVDQRKVIDQLRNASLAQQFLGTAYDTENLYLTIKRALMLRELLHNNMLQKLISQIHSLPSLPTLYLQIADQLTGPNPSADKVGQIIAQDLSMTAKVLQIVNSAHFGLPYPVGSPTQATTLLGLETIRDLVLSIKVFSSFDQLKIRQLGLTVLWNHSIAVGAYAKQIAKSTSFDKAIVNYAFTAGLLHDIGKLVLAENLPMKYQQAMGQAIQKKIPLNVAEEDIFGANHAQIGAYLLWLWNLPEQVVTATAYHHNPLGCFNQSVDSLSSVHMANAFSYELNQAQTKWPNPQISQEYINHLPLKTPVPQLRKICEDLTAAT